MIQKRLPALIQEQPAFDFLHSVVRGMSPPDDESGRELFGLAREKLPASENAFNVALATGDEDQILAATDELVWTVMMLGNFFPPLEHRRLEVERERARELRDKKQPSIDARKKLLEDNFNIEAIARAWKYANAVAAEFEQLCENNGLETVGARQIQRYAADILSERSKKP